MVCFCRGKLTDGEDKGRDGGKGWGKGVVGGKGMGEMVEWEGGEGVEVEYNNIYINIYIEGVEG